MKFNSVTIAPMSSIEVGDLIAREFLGTVLSGKVTGIAHAAYQLTNEQRAYMVEHGLEIPEDQYVPLAGHGYKLIFGDFTEIGSINGEISAVNGKMGHFYVDVNVNVAVFPTKEK